MLKFKLDALHRAQLLTIGCPPGFIAKYEGKGSPVDWDGVLQAWTDSKIKRTSGNSSITTRGAAGGELCEMSFLDHHDYVYAANLRIGVTRACISMRILCQSLYIIAIVVIITCASFCSVGFKTINLVQCADFNP